MEPTDPNNPNNPNNPANNQYGLIDTSVYEQLLSNAQRNIGRPERPEFESLLGDDGLIAQPYQLQNDYNTGALDRLRTEFDRGAGEQSELRRLQGQQLSQESARAAAQAQSNTQTGLDQLATTGGLRSGAAERLAQRGIENTTRAQQGILGQRLGLDVQDEQNRIAGLGALNQAEQAAANNSQGIQQFNIGNSLNDITQGRAVDVNNYNEDIRAFAAQQTANATPSSSGGGKK